MTTHQLILPQLNLCQFPCRLCYCRMETKIHDEHHYGMPNKGNHSPETVKQGHIIGMISRQYNLYLEIFKIKVKKTGKL